ncbi:MAG: glycosyltransferase family 4 protein [Clostridiales bacterium]|jgi:glycosyltransferase involved in cell wall biosynthesis|nr:glycosyltransferase family 4 protein [Clostridiales bacterium]
MKVAFISEYDVHDKKGWSGTISFLYRTLEHNYEIIPIVIKPLLIQRILHKVCFIVVINLVIDRILNSIRLKRKVKKAIMMNVDVYFAPVASKLLGCYSLPDFCKLVYLSDATYHNMVGYYFKTESKSEIRIRDSLEKATLLRANHIIYSSEWPKKDAIEHYKIHEDKISIVKFGANLRDEFTVNKKEKQNVGEDRIRLLFVGVDWERKGADLAIECVQLINKSTSKWKFDLTVVGLDKPYNFYSPDVIFSGRLNKDNPNEYESLIQHFQNSDIFILPTKAECSAIVFCEAAMYGLTVFTHNTGGVMSYVEDFRTGRTLELGSTAQDFADAVLDMLENKKLLQWSKSSREKYEQELNWDNWLVEVMKIL